MTKEMLRLFQKEIDYEFKNQQYLLEALTHSSYANEKGWDKSKCNERLEFLGDAVLELLISAHIFNTHDKMPEGEMTKLRAAIVCEGSLSAHAKKLRLGEFLLLGKGEEATGGRNRDSILADAFESVLGAIFLDSGIENARRFAMEHLAKDVESMNLYHHFDYKTQLQERIQSTSKHPVSYVIVAEKGPEHEKIFLSNAMHCGEVIGTGAGKTKKEAEQQAARMAVEKMEEA